MAFIAFVADTVHLASIDVREPFLLAHPLPKHRHKDGSKVGSKKMTPNIKSEMLVY